MQFQINYHAIFETRLCILSETLDLVPIFDNLVRSHLAECWLGKKAFLGSSPSYSSVVTFVGLYGFRIRPQDQYGHILLVSPRFPADSKDQIRIWVTPKVDYVARYLSWQSARTVSNRALIRVPIGQIFFPFCGKSFQLSNNANEFLILIAVLYLIGKYDTIFS